MGPTTHPSGWQVGGDPDVWWPSTGPAPTSSGPPPRMQITTDQLQGPRSSGSGSPRPARSTAVPPPTSPSTPCAWPSPMPGWRWTTSTASSCRAACPAAWTSASPAISGLHRPRHPQPDLPGRLHRQRPGAAGRAGHRRRSGDHGRVRPRRRPVATGGKSGDAYRRAAGNVATGFSGLGLVAGPRNPTSGYALAAQRHMNRYGTTSEQLGAIAVGQREWAAEEPAGPLPRPHHAGGPPGITVGRPTAAPPGLLHGVERRRRRGRHVGRTGPGPAATARARVGLGADAPRLPHGTRFGVGPGQRGGDRRTGGDEDGRRHARRHRRPGDLRLLHVHDADHAGGLRLLRQGRGRPARRVAGRWRRAVRCRRTPAAGSCPATTCGG